jgi:hypothetical protein
LSSSDRQGRPQKGEWNDGEFESFLADNKPAHEGTVGRRCVAGSLGNQGQTVDPSKLIITWPDISDRIVEELR